jgi:hypothetical protein
VFAASESIAGADTALNIVLGVGLVLLFAGILIRALAAKPRNLTTMARLRGLLRSMGARAARPDRDLLTPSAAPDHPGAEKSPAQSSPRTSRPPEPVAAPRAGCSDRPASADVEHPESPRAVREVPEPELTRLRPASVRRLGRTLDESRRLRAAEACVAGELAALPERFWLVERNVQLGAHRIPFLAIGASGIFVICATDGAWTLHDLHVLSDLGEQLRRQLPGYDGPVHAAVCLAFDEMKPRSWFGGQGERGRGGWVLGQDWLRTWMLSVGPEHGLPSGDIRRLDQASGPFWDRRSTARLSPTRNAG